MAAMFLANSPLPYEALPVAGGAITVSVALCTAALALHWHGQGPWRRRVLWGLSLAILAAGAVWEAQAGPISAAWTAPAALLLTEASLWARPGKRAVALVIGSLAVAALAAALAQAGLVAAQTVVMTILLVPTIAVGVVCQLWHYQVARELEKARGLAADLAVAEERLRFAGELHDVQGGNLQAITLKAQVARRLVAVDPERAEAEMRAVEELARTALKDTREVVGGYRKVALADEIDSAARILKSAGVQATVPDAAPSLDEDTEKLLGLLVREATTNLIRHAEPTAADVSIVEVDAEVTVTITNNGAPAPVGTGNGLTMLKNRFTEAGGNVEHVHDGDRFVLKGTVPRALAPQAKRRETPTKRRAGRVKPRVAQAEAHEAEPLKAQAERRTARVRPRVAQAEPQEAEPLKTQAQPLETPSKSPATPRQAAAPVRRLAGKRARR
jgi:two-component system, NarL family, sensor histidine kinase DesK